MSARDWVSNRRGEWYVAAQVVLMAAAILVPILDGRLSAGFPLVTGGVFCAAGLAFVVMGSMALGRNLSPFPKPRDDGVLIQEGIFSLVRHPIYTGFVLFALGWSLVWGSFVGVVGTVILLVFFDLKARREERWLEETFNEYAEYRRRVRKLIPFLY